MRAVRARDQECGAVVQRHAAGERAGRGRGAIEVEASGRPPEHRNAVGRARQRDIANASGVVLKTQIGAGIYIPDNAGVCDAVGTAGQLNGVCCSDALPG